MPKGKEITFYEREKIETYLRMKKKKTWIAKKLNRDYSVVKREIKRNSGDYLPYVAIDANKIKKGFWLKPKPNLSLKQKKVDFGGAKINLS